MVAPTTVPEATIEQLRAMGREKFWRVIEGNLHGDPDSETSRQVSAALLSPELIDRYHSSLLSKLKSVEGQLGARAADLEARRSELRLHNGADHTRQWLELSASYAAWRAGALRFKTSIEQALVEVRARRDEFRDLVWADVMTEERDRLAAKVEQLRGAIRRHRDAFPAEDEPSDTDLILWKVIE